MAARARSNDTLADLIQVGAFFGFVAGVLVLGLVVAWTLLERLWGPGAPFWPTVALHALYLIVYAAAGGVIGAFWPGRERPAVRLGLWHVAMAAFGVTITSVARGPIWTWSFGVWWRYALMTILFALVWGRPDRAARKPGPPAPPGAEDRAAQ